MNASQIEEGQALTRRMATGLLKALDQHMAGTNKHLAKASPQPASGKQADGYLPAPAKRSGVVK